MRKLFLFLMLVATVRCLGQQDYINQSLTKNSAKPKRIFISGQFDQLGSGDTIKVQVTNYLSRRSEGTDLQNDFQTELLTQDGHFNIELPPMEKPGYVTVYAARNDNRNTRIENVQILESYLIEPGDSIHIHFFEKKMQFSGRGSAKYRCQYRISEQRNLLFTKFHLDQTKDTGFIISHINLSNEVAFSQASIKSGKELLNNYKDSLDKLTYEILNYDIVGSSGLWVVKNFSLAEEAAKYKSLSVDSVELFYKRHFSNPNTHLPISNNLIYSMYYPHFLLKKIILDSFTIRKRDFDAASYYNAVKAKYNGIVRECLLSTILVTYAQKGLGDVTNSLQDAYSTFKDEGYKRRVEMLINNKGAAFYDFHLPDTNGSIKSLQDFKGKVLLLDFWFTGCGNCRRLHTAMSGVEAAFKNNPDVVFASVSIDRDINTWKNTVKGGQYCSPSYVNLYTDGKGAEHELIKRYNIFGYPTILVIGKDGKLISSPAVDPRLDQGKDLIALIKRAL